MCDYPREREREREREGERERESYAWFKTGETVHFRTCSICQVDIQLPREQLFELTDFPSTQGLDFS
ncbi:hypothetical protein Y032_0032g2561 [Ancylostoma ceylanicum]|uniref:Uncharacterized protein n=1 Tax=Ancylostoma ceylanicum TaxID=53326 RepID=A0A016UPV6_9BILA|nr:hypothetical protein Y032_0032g2561 [Ancylostoma ceylanicum]